MSSDDVVISARNLSKCYHLYERPGHRLQQFFMPRLGSVLGRGRQDFFKEFWALRDVSFEISRGETVGVVGRNGSGKSTLLQLLCGTLTPTYGDVEVRGRVAALLELGAGFNPDFTGRENIYLNAAVLGMSREQIEARFDQIAGFADIDAFIDQPLKTYSSGMAVRLAFAVATSVDADILVIDEALSVGDFAFQAKCMRRMRRFIDDGGTLLFVSHDINAVKTLCARSIYLRQGALRQIGPSELVCDQYLADANRADGFAAEHEQLPALAAVAQDGVARVTPEAVADFRRRVAPFQRHASSQCEFASVEVVDAQGNPVGLAAWGQKLCVRMVLMVNEPIEHLVIAFYLRDRLQVDIMGTNTEYEGIELRDLQSGQWVEVTFSFTNFLRAGEYGVCAIAADKAIVTSRYFSWIDHAASVRTSDRDGQVAWAVFNPRIEAQSRCLQP